MLTDALHGPESSADGVPFDRLGSRHPEVDHTSLLLCPQSVREGRDPAGSPKARDSGNCRHFWTFAGKVPRLTIVATVVTFGASLHRCVSRVSTVSRMGSVGVAICVTVVAFGAASKSHMDVSCWSRNQPNDRRFWSLHMGRASGGRDPHNCHHFSSLVASPRVKSVNNHMHEARSAQLSSLWEPRCVVASQKPQQSHEWGVSA